MSTRAQGREQIDRAIGFNDEPRVGVGHGDFLDRNGLRIQIRRDAGDADGTPFHQVFAEVAVHGGKILEPGIAGERDLRQFILGRAQMNVAVESEFAVEDEQVEPRFEIGIQRAQLHQIEGELDVRRQRLQRGGHVGADDAVGVPAQRERGGQACAGHIGNVRGRQRNVIECERGGP